MPTLWRKGWMVGWLGSEFRGHFFEMYIWLAYFSFGISARKGWMVGCGTHGFRDPQISKMVLYNHGTLNEGMGDGLRWQFHGQILQHHQLNNLIVPADLRIVGWMVWPIPRNAVIFNNKSLTIYIYIYICMYGYIYAYIWPYTYM